MTARFRYEVDLAHSVALLRPRGTLDALSATDLRSAMVECLVEQPVAVVLDTVELVVADDIALTVLGSVARESLRWPGTRFVLGGTDTRLATAIDRMGVGQYLTVFANVAGALAECGRWPVPPRLRRHIDPDRYAPALARDAVETFCTGQGVVGTDAAQLVASELVTNAVLHAKTGIDLTLRFIRPYLHIAVRDHGPGQARITGHIDESHENGRGLLLVDALASAWGNLFPLSGKIVWATVRVRSISASDDHGGKPSVSSGDAGPDWPFG